MPDTLVGEKGDELVAERAKYSADQLSQMAKNGQAMPDGSYPIADREDLQNAIHAVGRGSGSHDAIRRHIIARAKALGASDLIPDNWNADGSMMNSAPTGDLFERSVPFTLIRSAESGDGLTLEGYAAVFNTPTQIRDMEGEYTETIAPGAFKRTINAGTPVLMFDHGQHPVIGSMPIGKIQSLKEDTRGLYVKARLFDSWMVEPLRQAIQAGAVDGMSFRFSVTNGGQRWNADKTERTLTELRVPELGPVVFPAYKATSVSLRSLAAAVPEVHIVVDETANKDDQTRTATEPEGEEIAELRARVEWLETQLAERGTPNDPATARTSDGPAEDDAPTSGHAPVNDHSLAARQRVARLTRARRMGAGR